tara:strand:+ start:2206 stop:2901 length:696 start_codon:yes stop_codon:yes gene_type:complete
MIAILQARTGSKRLPKKILKKINKITLLEHIVNRLKYSKKIKKIIIATTNNSEDNIVEKISTDHNVSCFRGSTNNVLNRYVECAKLYKANDIIRLTADDPFIDPQIIDKLINKYINGRYDFVSNTPNQTFPLGLDVTIVNYKTLSEIEKLTNKKKHFEHVVTYLFENKNKYKYFYYDRKIDEYSQMRWTVDYVSDLKFVRKVYKNLYNKKNIFLFNDIIKYLNSNNIKSYK